MIDIRLPNINGATEKEQLAQIKSYLYQFAEQLQWALGAVETENQQIIQQQKAVSSASVGSVSNFAELKSLIIKSADIVNAYYEKIDNLIKLSGDYTASSDFGDFEEKTSLWIDATDKKINQNVTDFQTIYDENGNVRTELLINGCIHTGIIDYNDGTPIIGIQIGQVTNENGTETFNQFARFTADKLSFYDRNAIEVAYISDSKLYITNAEVKGNLKLGRFVLDTANGIALRWEG